MNQCRFRQAFGSPNITDWSGGARTASAYGNRVMFSGRDYMGSLGLYDIANRVYDPVMGRFYQTDPIGFAGDSWNLYRFSSYNPLLGGDPTGLEGIDFGPLGENAAPTAGDPFSSLSADQNWSQFGAYDGPYD